MKTTLYLFLVSVILSCGNNSKHNDKNKAISDFNTNKKQALLKRFKPFIQGVWVKQAYIDELTKTNSPYQSSGKLGGLADIDIEIKTWSADSIVAGASLNNHEGASFTIYLTMGKKPNSLKISQIDYEVNGNFYELGYLTKKNDTSLILYHYSKKSKLLDSTVYAKILNRQDSDDAGYGIQYITNKILVAGKYAVIDSTGFSSKVELTNDGIIKGLPDARNYYISTDFVVAIENNLDEIYFNMYDRKNQKSYNYQLIKDTLKLYETLENADSTLLVRGKLKYKFIRQQ